MSVATGRMSSHSHHLHQVSIAPGSACPLQHHPIDEAIDWITLSFNRSRERMSVATLSSQLHSQLHSSRFNRSRERMSVATYAQKRNTKGHKKFQSLQGAHVRCNRCFRLRYGTRFKKTCQEYFLMRFDPD